MPQAPANRAAVVSRPQSSARRSNFAGRRRPSARPNPGTSRGPSGPGAPAGEKAEHEIIFQQYFKSVGPRTYAAQVKRANNGNHYLVLTEGKRDDATGEVRKTKLFLFGEDFVEFFKMLQATAQFIRANPVPDEVKKKRERYWAKQGREAIAPQKQKSNPDPAPVPQQSPRP
jgi:hypothetical protein